MSMLDSAAVFAARAQEMGMAPEEMERLKAKGWNTFALLAFACSYMPGQADDVSLRKLGAAICGTGAEEPPESRMPIIRRLFFEAYTLAAADLRSRVERRDDDAPRKLAMAERSQRNRDQELRLSGVSLDGEREVSHALVDLIVQMSEDNALKYVRWEVCTKRDAELLGLKTDPVWRPDPVTGLIRSVRLDDQVSADTSTDLLLRNALQRRALAFDNCRLISYSAFEKWTDLMLDAFLAPAITGHMKVSIEQLHRADVALFKHMIRETRDGIRMTAAGSFPAEDALRSGIVAAEVRLCLQPLQGVSQVRRQSEAYEPPAPGAGTGKRARKRKQEEERSRNEQDKRRREQNLGRDDIKGDSKGKGKNKTKGGPRMPNALIGMDSRTSDLRPICYNYNMIEGCTLANPGGTCSKGVHVCCRPGCHKAHSQRVHDGNHQ
jgi:hypothetical protein